MKGKLKFEVSTSLAGKKFSIYIGEKENLFHFGAEFTRLNAEDLEELRIFIYALYGAMKSARDSR